MSMISYDTSRKLFVFRLVIAFWARQWVISALR